LVDLKADTYSKAMALRYGQELPDSVVLASILEHIAGQDRGTPTLFTTRDRDLFGFAKGVLHTRFDCTCIPKYDDALKFIEARTRP
jgi:hypothetical protein